MKKPPVKSKPKTSARQIAKGCRRPASLLAVAARLRKIATIYEAMAKAPQDWTRGWDAGRVYGLKEAARIIKTANAPDQEREHKTL